MLDLNNIKVGDEVKSCTKGWGEVFSTGLAGFRVKFLNQPSSDEPFLYLYDGKFNEWEETPEIIDWKSKKQKVEKWIVFYRDVIDEEVKIDTWLNSETPVYCDSEHDALNEYTTQELSDSSIPKPVKVTWYE